MHALVARSAVVFAVILFMGTWHGVANAQEANEGEGKLIQIGPDRGADGQRPRRGWLRQPGFREAPTVISRYWIGVSGGGTPPEVRAHVELDEGVGVMLRSVEPGSPAEEGGLQTYDIVTRVNGDPVVDMRQLAEAVGEAGKNKARLTLELIREGRPTTVWVAPAERPVAPAIGRERPGAWFGGFRGVEPFGGELPGGVSVSVTRSGDGPAKVTVQRDGETWEVDADDPEAIAALPEEIRPFVERAVGGAPARGGFGAGGFGERFGMDFGERFPDFAPGDLQQRLQEMEQQVQALRQRFGDLNDPPQAQPLDPEDVEIPAEN